MKRWYLSGPMTGLPLLNHSAFNAEAARLRALGFDVVNPAEINTAPDAAWSDCMRVDIAALVTCDGLAMLPGSAFSRGALLERYIAEQLDMLVFEAECITHGPGVGA